MVIVALLSQQIYASGLRYCKNQPRYNFLIKHSYLENNVHMFTLDWICKTSLMLFTLKLTHSIFKYVKLLQLEPNRLCQDCLFGSQLGDERMMTKG